MSLRIIASSADQQANAFAADGGGNVDQYMERLVKLVPAESIAAYPLLSSYASVHGWWAMVLVSWTLLVVSAVLRWRATASAQGGAQPQSVVIACISFVIWVYVMDGHFGLSFLLDEVGIDTGGDQFASVREFLSVYALVVWTLLVPAFYKGDSE